jgi:signal transduction histidine kinase
MTRAARSIGLADLSWRVPVPSSRDELSRLAEAWNEMLARLEDSVARIQRFTADAAHELRTPLTALRTTAELAVRRERESSEYRESLEQVVNISERMSNLVDELLTLARGDTATPGKGLGVVDLTAVVRSVCREMQPLFASKNVELIMHTTEQAPVRGDAAGLKRLLTSLVENALKYTAAAGRVNVSVRQEGSEQVMEVADTGCGIPPELLPHIFDRFYRVDSSRDRRSGGYGLGLAIAQQIAHFHNSEIDVKSVAGKGSCFRLRLATNAANDEAGPHIPTYVPSKA